MRVHLKGFFLAVLPVSVLPVLFVIAASGAKAAVINVTTTNQKVSSTGGCSLLEAIYSANFRTNVAVDFIYGDQIFGTKVSDYGKEHFITTSCAPGSGDDTIVLPAGATFSMEPWPDVHNYVGRTATPFIFSTITIEANGAHLKGGDPAYPNYRAFAVGPNAVTLPGGLTVSGTGSLTIRNADITGFTVKGGAGGPCAGGGMGAGGAIYVTAGHLIIENSTFAGNGATGGDGDTCGVSHAGAGGGGGLSGDGGLATTKGGFPTLEGGGGGGAGAAGAWSGGGTWSENLLCGGTPAQGSPTQGFRDGGDATCAGGGGSGANYWGNGGNGAYGGGGGGGGDDENNGGIPTFGGRGGFGGGGGGKCGAAGFGGGGGGGAFCGTPPSSRYFGGTGTIWVDYHAGLEGHLPAGGGGAGLGGAIFNEGGFVTIRNSTFNENFAQAGGANEQAGKSAGGAIFSLNGALTVQNSTISRNHSNGPYGIKVDTGLGGGIEVYATSTASFGLYNTIVTNNGGFECLFDTPAGGGIVYPSGTHNLIGSNLDCPGPISPYTDPHLGALLPNQGPTRTMAISNTSSAFNTADPQTSLKVDQRGQQRPSMGGYDVGAFQLCMTGPAVLQMPCVIYAGQVQSAPATNRVSTIGGFLP